MTQPEHRIVLEHPSGKVAAGASLHLHVNEHDLGIPVMGLHLGHDVRFAPTPFGEVREQLLLQEP